MILSRPDILSRLEQDSPSFDPKISKDRVKQVSIDLTLGRRFTTFKKSPGFIASIQMDDSLWNSQDLWDKEQEADTFMLKAGGFVLGQTLERVVMPPDLMGLVEGRSGFARIGLAVHLTAPKIDPGFKGHITLEMANFGEVPIQLRAGIDKPAQLILARITTELSGSDLYGESPEDLFQNQVGTVPRSRSHRPTP